MKFFFLFRLDRKSLNTLTTLPANTFRALYMQIINYFLTLKII